MLTAARLRERREQAGLTQGQVAQYEGITPQYLYKLEQGVNNPPAWPLLAKLARRYRCTTDYLLGLTENPQGYAPTPELPEAVAELVELAGELSAGRQGEQLEHARVLVAAEQEANLREYDRLMALVTALLEWRDRRALENGIPGHVIATDVTVRAIAETRPTTSDELSRIPGMWSYRVADYGADLLALVAAHPVTADRGP